MLRFIQKKKQNKCFGVFFIPQRGNLHNFNDEVCVGLCKDSTHEGAAPHKATRKIVKKKNERKEGGERWEELGAGFRSQVYLAINILLLHFG